MTDEMMKLRTLLVDAHEGIKAAAAKVLAKVLYASSRCVRVR